MYADNVLVSVLCITYNHEKYIEQTLEGFVKQKTNFKFEVIVHDDASTDKTADLIRKYAEKYPNIIKPIYEKENQYSKGNAIMRNIMLPIAKGEYIAWCEGDDYWCDTEKLQTQIDYLIENPDCSVCVHNSRRISEDGKDCGLMYNITSSIVEYSTDDIILAGGCGLFHTSSFCFKKKLMEQKPDEFAIKGSGDYSMAIWLSLCGRVVFVNRIMSAYRVMAIGSWNYRNKKDKKLRILSRQRHIEGLEKIDKLTNYKYHNSIVKRVNVNKCRKFKYEGKIHYILFNPSLWGIAFNLMLKSIKNRFKTE